MKYHLYFAYGANMNIKNMKHRCPAAKPIGKARLDGYRLKFRRGVATVEPQAKEYAPGALWKVTDACIASLDRFEGYPWLYGRYQIGGKDVNGRSLPGIHIYIMQPGYVESPPSNFYLDVILEGYKDFGWGRKEQERLRRTACKIKKWRCVKNEKKEYTL